ncbi:MAG: toprim domain-containing protein, partial [Candidatus Babeliales bacterium]
MTNSNTSELCPQDLSDLLETCRQHMAENGLECQDPLNTDGNIHRYAVNDNTCKRNQWYVAHDGISAKGNRYLICVYGDWITGVKYKFISWNKNVLLNRESRKELNELLRKKQLETMSKLQKTRDAAATEAQRIWNESPVEPPSDEYLRYIKNKGIEPIGLRFGLNSNNYPSIIIDVKNIEGQIRSLQYISVDDNGKTYKTFFDGGELKGNFHTIGTIIDGDPIFVTEGYATGVSVHLATGIATVIAFSAHGLLCVIEKLKKKFAKSTVTIAGDNDKVGAEKATDAAKKICCSIALPIFPETIDPIPEGKSYTDFNDLHVTCGLDEVKRQLTAAALPPTEANRLKIIIRKSLLEKDACANFRISSLPKILGDYVSIISETTNAHPIMVTSSVLTTFTAFLEKRVFIPEGEYFQTLFPNL